MKKPIRFVTLTLVFFLLVFAQTFIRITPAVSSDSHHQKSEDFSLLAQATERDNSDCKMGVVLFTGFASQTLLEDEQQTGMHQLARKLEALASPQLTTKVLSWYDDDDDDSNIDSDDIANGDIEAEVNRVANMPDSNGLVLIGHSLGGDEALEQAALRERVDLLIQIDSVGYNDSVKPNSVVRGVNYYQTKQSTVPSWAGRDIETNVRGSLNINVSEFDSNLDHGTIDDSDIVHQNIIQKIQATAKSVCQLPEGIYYGLGSMFNNSRREILHGSQKSCIKIVDGPASPYQGQEEIMISSLSLNNGKIYIDTLGEEIQVHSDTNTEVNFTYNGGGRTSWHLRSRDADSRTTPHQDAKMEECLNSQGNYSHRMTGISIPGIAF